MTPELPNQPERLQTHCLHCGHRVEADTRERLTELVQEHEKGCAVRIAKEGR